LGSSFPTTVLFNRLKILEGRCSNDNLHSFEPEFFAYL
jgi:hypothetical protein